LLARIYIIAHIPDKMMYLPQTGTVYKTTWPTLAIK